MRAMHLQQLLICVSHIACTAAIDIAAGPSTIDAGRDQFQVDRVLRYLCLEHERRDCVEADGARWSI